MPPIIYQRLRKYSLQHFVLPYKELYVFDTVPPAVAQQIVDEYPWAEVTNINKTHGTSTLTLEYPRTVGRF